MLFDSKGPKPASVLLSLNAWHFRPNVRLGPATIERAWPRCSCMSIMAIRSMPTYVGLASDAPLSARSRSRRGDPDPPIPSVGAFKLRPGRWWRGWNVGCCSVSAFYAQPAAVVGRADPSRQPHKPFCNSDGCPTFVQHFSLLLHITHSTTATTSTTTPTTFTCRHRYHSLWPVRRFAALPTHPHKHTHTLGHLHADVYRLGVSTATHMSPTLTPPPNAPS